MKGIDYVIVALVALIAILGTAFIMPTKVDTKYVVNETVKIVEVPTADNTTLDIRNKLFEEEDFKAIALAKAEAKLDSEDLFDWMVENNYSIWDLEDISSITIDDSEVSNIDVDDKDATVVLNLIVRYENSDGDNTKTKIDATFIVNDGKIKDSGVTFIKA
jgi:hypothetical protein